MQVDLQWVQVLSEGWASPLSGFMTEREFLQTQHFGGLLANGQLVNQSVPIVLALSCDDKQRSEGSATVTLNFNGRPVAIVRSPEFYEHRKEERCSRQFGTTSIAHPYVKVS